MDVLGWFFGGLYLALLGGGSRRLNTARGTPTYPRILRMTLAISTLFLTAIPLLMVIAGFDLAFALLIALVALVYLLFSLFELRKLPRDSLPG